MNIDELQNVRRILERGLKEAQADKKYIDIFQHALDLLESAGLIYLKENTLNTLK